MTSSETDDDLVAFAERGLSVPAGGITGCTEHDGARIWHASYGSGRAVILLHGGMGHSGNWGKQIGQITDAGFRAIVIDTRGHGRSTRDERPFSYELMAQDVRAVMEAERIDKAVLVGWSDGACTALILAREAPERVSGVIFFACNMDPTGTKDLDESNPLLGRCFSRHTKDYAVLSPAPDGFQNLATDLGVLQRTQPNYTADDLASIRVPVVIVIGENDEFIKREHAEYLARTIPGAEFRLLPGVSHFAPIQRPDVFNTTIVEIIRSFMSPGRPS